MKYLKRFNESNEDLSQDIEWIKDSLLELTDMNYKVSIRTYGVYGISNPGLEVRIESDGKLLPISIGEYLLTIHSYLTERGYLGFNSYDYDNEYSQSRHRVRVRASLKGIENKYETEISDFVKMLDRFKVNAPFDAVQVNYYKPN